jgi:drug/metabolite transporter (DMT)-like permease
MKSNHLAELFALGALWGGSLLFMSVAVPEIGPLTTIGLRLLLAASVLAFVLALRHGLRSMQPHWGPLVLLGVLNSALPFGLMAFAMLSITTRWGRSSTPPTRLSAPIWLGGG